MMARHAFILILAVWAIAVPVARGEYTDTRPVARPPEPADALSMVPRSAELILVIDRFDTFIDSPLGEVIWRLVTDLAQAGGGQQTVKNIPDSWTRLATELGMTREDAVGRLVGNRVVLVMRDLETSGQRQWAVLSVISEQTDRDLITRLRPARRGIVEGHAIRSIEEGRYEVATHLHEPPATPADPKRTWSAPGLGTPRAAGANVRDVSLLIGESGRSALFDEVVGVWSGRVTQTLAQTDLAREAASRPAAQILLAIRVDPDDDAARHIEHDWTNFILLTGRVTETGLDLGVVLRDQHHQDELAQIRPWSDAPFAALQSAAALAVIESRLDRRPGDEHASSKPSPARAAFVALGLNEPLQDLLVGRQLLVVREHPAQPTPGGPRISLVLGAETSDIAALSKLGDHCINENVQKMEGLATGSPVPQSLNLAGVACEAVRRTRADVPEGELLAGLLGTPVDIAWTYVPARTERGAPGTSVPGWWVVNMGSTPVAPSTVAMPPVAISPVAIPPPTTLVTRSPAVRPAERLEPCGVSIESVRDTLRTPPPGADPGDVRRWFSVGVLRPAMLIRALSPIIPPLGIEKTLNRCESLQWRLFVTPEHDIEGTISLRVLDAPVSQSAPTPP